MNGRLLWRAGVVVVILAIVAALVNDQWGAIVGRTVGSKAAAGKRGPEPCLPGTRVPVIASPHIPWKEAESTTYNSNPPTSGPHFSFALAPGIYDGPVPDGLTVHALEHGHVAILYAADTPRKTVQELRSIAKRHARDVVLAPYAGLPHGLALTAWGRIDRLDTFDGPRVVRFVERLHGRYDHGWTRPEQC